MRENILSLMKVQLKNVADEITFENYKEMEEQVHRIFTILESSESMLESGVHQPSVSDVEEPQTYEEGLQEYLATEQKNQDEHDQQTMQELLDEEEAKLEEIDGSEVYSFERRIKAGVIPEIEAYVPEKVIHDLDLSHGDKIRAKFLFKPLSGAPTRYEYSLAEKADPPRSPDNIVEINMGIVSYEPRLGGYAISKTVHSDEIIHEGEKVTLPLVDEDVDSLDLREGDVVNAAFYVNNTEYTRVRWKYSTEEVAEEQSSPKRSSSYYKSKDKEKEEVPQVLKDKKVAVLGYEPGWPAYREEVEKRGGELLTLTGREPFDTIYGTIKKSDCLIMILGHVGHTGTIFSVDYCKKNNIPQTSLKTFGRSSFVDAAIELVEN